jgi:cyclophilin family peptidyl-prolyl cis-trans isomerase
MEDPFLRAALAGRLTSIVDLARLARDPEIRVREAAVAAAGERGRDGFAICITALQDSDPVVAANAAGGLGAMGPQEPDPKAKEPPPPAMDADQVAEAVAALDGALAAHPAPDVAPDDWGDLRASALEALGKLKAPQAASLARAHLGDPDPLARDFAAKVLEEIEKKKPEMPQAPRLLPFVDRAELRVVDEGAPRVRFETERGTFVVRTLPSAAPVHCARFLARVRAGGYDGTVFHRIVPAFVVQGGDPRGDGSGSGGACLRQEFSAVPYRRGTLGVPRNSPPESGGCQLFFCHGETPHLDQRYTVTGEIVEGVEVLDRIDLGDRILRATVDTAY